VPVTAIKGADINRPPLLTLALSWSIGAVTKASKWRQGDILMFRARLFLVSLVAALSAVALLASSASALIAYQWKVNTKTLAAGEQRTFTASAESTFDLKGTIGGAAVLLLSSALKVTPGGRIIGGKPGTAEEQVVFEDVTVDKPADCEVESLPNPVEGTVRTVQLKSQIVESRISREPLILFSPEEGTVLAELRFLGEDCVVDNEEANITGNVVADPLPHLTEVLTGLLDFEPSTGNEFFLSTGSAAETAGLKLGGEPAKLGGTALVTLLTDEKFGAF
jgi:hypothetical protein